MSDPSPVDSPAVRKPRQMKLFHLENPLTQRFGSEFFRELPQSPGVYFFYDAQDRLLYIGQSSDLRARLGSYRHVSEDKHPRRTLRLVARITRIEWRGCDSAAEAVQQEALLLLEHRPPFNRAGVWKGEPWWLSVQVREGALDLLLSHEQGPASIGPLPAGFRHSLPTLVRCLLRAENPSWRLGDYPCGVMRGTLPLEFSLPTPQPARLSEHFATAHAGGSQALFEACVALPPPPTLSEQEFWSTELENLARMSGSTAKPPASG